MLHLPNNFLRGVPLGPERKRLHQTRYHLLFSDLCCPLPAGTTGKGGYRGETRSEGKCGPTGNRARKSDRVPFVLHEIPQPIVVPSKMVSIRSTISNYLTLVGRSSVAPNRYYVSSLTFPAKVVRTPATCLATYLYPSLISRRPRKIQSAPRGWKADPFFATVYVVTYLPGTNWGAAFR